MPREFRDDQGRSWLVRMNVEQAKRVKGMVQIVNEQGKLVPFDLLDTGSINQTITVLRSQFIVAAEVLHALLVNQIADRGLTREQFLESLNGDCLDEARKIVEDEVIDFFPKGLRKMIRLMADKMTEVQGTMLGRAEAQLEAVSVEALLEQSGTQSTKPQESSESIQATGHTESLQLQETPG